MSNPARPSRSGSRTYSLYYAGEQIRTIAWHEDGAAYWIQNTLTNSVSPREMLAMAAQTVPVISPSHAPVAAVAPGASSLKLPPRPTTATSSRTSKLEAALGLLGLLAVAGLTLFVLWRQRELMRLHEQVARAMALEAHQRTLLATNADAGSTADAGIPAPEPAPFASHPSG